ncbi:MAG: SsrA-binding protein SmpB [Chloroflexi bacterium]|jgi:SsrA-binding protein|nr:SsrA-binding protein SmpB [Chloroflexota bacterium]MDL1882790.1 SsrA-binding protein SmpB [Anaerolineae bacterium CFX8]
MSQKNGVKIVARNKKAFHDYHIEDTYQAGIALQGSEIKSIRAGNVSLQEGYVEERKGELWLVGVHIAPYEQASRFGHSDPLRPRKLLLHRREIAQLITKMRERGYTVIPINIHLERGLAKVEIALAKGKKLYDKRASIAKRDSDREIKRALKENY